MKSLILIVLLMAAQIGHAMDKHPTRAMLSLPSNNNNNLAFEDQDDQGLDGIMNPAKKHKCQHPDCIDREPFASSSGLRMHELSHKLTIEEQRPYPCRIEGCTMRFPQEGHRDAHERSFSHTGVKLYACSFENCTKRFSRKQDRENHENIDHRSIIGNNNQCPVCQRIITRARNMPSHIRTHTGEKPYQCECGKRCARSDSLKTHKRTCPEHQAMLSAAQSPQDHNHDNGQPPSDIAAFALLALACNNPNVH